MPDKPKFLALFKPKAFKQFRILRELAKLTGTSHFL